MNENVSRMNSNQDQSGPTLPLSVACPSKEHSNAASESIASIENASRSSGASFEDKRSSGQKTVAASGTSAISAASSTDIRIGACASNRVANLDCPEAAVSLSKCEVVDTRTANTNLPRNLKAVLSDPRYKDDQHIIIALIQNDRQKNFAENLHSIVSVPAYHYVLRWNPKGDAFGIYDTETFVNTIMSTHFQKAKFDSFTRRMRRWGFRRTESMNEKMRGLVFYKCKFFVREKPELCKMMCDDRQRKNKGPSLSQNTTSQVVTKLYSRCHNKRVGNGQSEPKPVHYPSNMPVPIKQPPSPNKKHGTDPTLPMLPTVHFPMRNSEQHPMPMVHHSSVLHHPSSPAKLYAYRHHMDQAVPMGIVSSPIMHSSRHYPVQERNTMNGMMHQNDMISQHGMSPWKGMMHHPGMMPFHQNTMAFESNPNNPQSGYQASSSSFPPRGG